MVKPERLSYKKADFRSKFLQQLLLTPTHPPTHSVVLRDTQMARNRNSPVQDTKEYIGGSEGNSLETETLVPVKSQDN